MTPQEALRLQMADEINKGRLLREQFGKEAGVSQEDMIRSDITPSISYVSPKGAVSTDEPPVEPIGSTRGSIDLMRLPIYGELIKQLRIEKLKKENPEIINNLKLK